MGARNTSHFLATGVLLTNRFFVAVAVDGGGRQEFRETRKSKLGGALVQSTALAHAMHSEEVRERLERGSSVAFKEFMEGIDAIPVQERAV